MATTVLGTSAWALSHQAALAELLSADPEANRYVRNNKKTY